ncbi:SusC/RagA family TonB-linked outer membrane protein [Reichenbachiella ulvae]|uniref:TonB-dependent receptor n=1 Tax=Reichenbachiella ulvae TaxID=2980104 RepID=A0ABT3CNS7_9BACT|nr:TonB-dependent receptor [Reichenbachiella ulvae]MCV9385252.1 TonB-dependent receptor [Reichenbachiella ulvae]
MKISIRKLSFLTRVFWMCLLLSAMVFSPGLALPSNKEVKDVRVTGKVTDEAGEGLPGASVLVKGTTQGTITDLNGEFSLEVPDDAVLVVSFIGYQTKEVATAGRTSFDVMLETDVDQLDEVVVVGYSTVKKQSLTSAVAVVDNEAIQTTTNSSLAQKLQGKVAGLQIRQQSGQPGVFDTDINIRGFGNPIYVIDGIRREGKGEFQQLNANDIESITVLKDASAAVYGLGAANGVILVTTKKGQKGAPKVNFGMNLGVLRPTNVPKMASASQYIEMDNDAFIYQRGTDGTPKYTQEEVAKWQAGNEPGYQSTDWYDETMKEQAIYQQYDVSVSGGADRISYYMGLEYTNENGLLQSNDMGYERYNLRSNITAQVTDNLEAQLLLGSRVDATDQPGTSFFGIFKGTRVSLPIDQPYANDNPDYLTPIYLDQNPVAFAERDVTGYNEDRTQSLQSSLSLKYTVPSVEGLSFKGLASYDFNNYQGKNLSKPYSLYTYDETTDLYNAVKYRDGSGFIQQRSRLNQYVTFQGYINYDKKFGTNHNLKTVLVYEQNISKRDDFRVRRYYDAYYTKDVLKFAGLTHESDSDPNQEADVSYIGRLDYSYADKYLFEVAARYMGSYRYAPSNRWGLFPMASVGWRISEENFIKDNIPVLSNLKIRGSYGIVGQPSGNAFQYVEGFALGSGGSYEFVEGSQVAGVSAPAPANAKLSWQTATTADIGIDIGLFEDKVTLVSDVYQRTLEGIPAYRSISLPDTYGGQLPQENLNSNMTRGFEIGIGHKNNIGKLYYNISGNYSISRTMKLHVEGETFTNSYSQWRNQSGDRWEGIVWAQDYIGQFQDDEDMRNSPLQNGRDGNITRALPGDLKYRDVNGDGVINGDDASPILSNATPRSQYGLNLDLRWNGFDFNMLWQGQSGHSIKFNEVYGTIFAFKGNTPEYFYDRWHQADPYNPDSEWIAGEYPASRQISDMPGMTYTESSMWRRDASYVRLKSIQLGYTFNNEVMSRVGISSLRLYASGFNLITIADPWVKAHDPERTNNGPGLSYNAGFGYPLSKTYTMGLSVNF